ncbi:hypothetical protein IHN63_02685 [Deinococcus sp. 6YEL10]|uniref:hypothetical protein n=1 Tax=Deinococcus sp. 6YEL10 TaxID=2745870 RepID=UPI001E635326|nr:hypothetical protein [Deinococcus sp. 6YEL10]MCD0160207.1 hypothetical protein [Deinococcus sp. 6YEL10]
MTWPYFPLNVSTTTDTTVSWIGPLTTDGDTPGQRAFIVGKHEGKIYHLNTLAAGELARARLHTVGSPPEVTEQFQADFDRQSCQPLLKDGQELLPPSSVLPAGIQPFMQHSICVCLPLNGDSCGIVIPVAEMLRHCYGSSSRLLQAVLSDQLPELLRQARSVSEIAGTQRRFHEVPGELQPGDLHMLTHLLADPKAEGRALQVDINISASFTTPRPGLKVSHFSALFPFSGQHPLTAQGRWVDTGTFRRFLVHRITRLDITPSITAALPTPDSPPDPTDGPPQTHRRSARKGTDPEELDSSRTTRRGNKMQVLKVQSSVFSRNRLGRFALGSAPLPNASSRSGPARTSALSTSPWSSQDATARPATLASPSLSAMPEFQPLLAALNYLRTQGHQITERPLAQNRAEQGFICLIHTMKATGGWVYLVEKDRPTPSSSGPLIVCWKADHSEASDEELIHLLSKRVGQRTWPKQVAGWTLRRVTHGYSTPQTFGQAILAALK